MASKFNLPNPAKIKAAIALTFREGAEDAKRHFTLSFRNQGFTDKSLEKWEPRKGGVTVSQYRELKSFWGKRISDEVTNESGRGILIKSGTLMQSIKTKQITPDSFTVVSDMGLPQSKDYAPVHNYGLRAGRGKGFIMPVRKFMGRSVVLENKIRKKLIQNISNCFK